MFVNLNIRDGMNTYEEVKDSKNPLYDGRLERENFIVFMHDCNLKKVFTSGKQTFLSTLYLSFSDDSTTSEATENPTYER